MLVKLNDKGEPVEWGLKDDHIKIANPNTSFPKTLTTELLAQFGYAKFIHTEQPNYEEDIQEVVEVTPRLDPGGEIWLQWWEVQEKFDTEEAKAAFLAEKAALEEESLIRDTKLNRNRLLSETDWMFVKATEVSDYTVPDAWKTYRQTLRDLSTHSNWPKLTADDWPEPPGNPIDGSVD